MDINEEFSALQSSYLKARAESDRCMNELYFFLKKYLLGFLKRYAAKKGVYLTDLEEKAEDAAMFFIEQYLAKPGWKVDRFTAYYGNAITKVLNNESVQKWDKLKLKIKRTEPSDFCEKFFVDDDIDEQLEKKQREQEEYETHKDEDAIKFMRKRWEQGSLFGEDENK